MPRLGVSCRKDILGTESPHGAHECLTTHTVSGQANAHAMLLSQRSGEDIVLSAGVALVWPNSRQVPPKSPPNSVELGPNSTKFPRITPPSTPVEIGRTSVEFVRDLSCSTEVGQISTYVDQIRPGIGQFGPDFDRLGSSRPTSANVSQCWPTDVGHTLTELTQTHPRGG